MKKMIDRSLWIGSLLCLIPLIFGLMYYSKMPETIAVHFNYAGNPDRYIRKEFVVLLFPVIALLLNIYVNIRLKKEALDDKAAKPLIWIGKWAVPVAFVFLQIFTILYSVGKNIPINTIITTMLGIIMIFCGNYFPKNRLNNHVGIKFLWLLHDEEAWNKTHRLSGYLWIIVGFILIFSPFIRIPFSVIFVVFILFIIIIPVIYSIIFHVKQK